MRFWSWWTTSSASAWRSSSRSPTTCAARRSSGAATATGRTASSGGMRPVPSGFGIGAASGRSSSECRCRPASRPTRSDARAVRRHRCTSRPTVRSCSATPSPPWTASCGSGRSERSMPGGLTGTASGSTPPSSHSSSSTSSACSSRTASQCSATAARGCGPPSTRGPGTTADAGPGHRTEAPSPCAYPRSRMATTTAEDRLRQQRRALPDGPGVYLLKDAQGKVLYVGKARSIRKRVASHFAKPATRGAVDMMGQVGEIDFIATETDAEALLAEQEFIKRHRPLFNVRLRDDKSYPYIGISLDEDYPRVYFTRERHRRGRAYFGPFSNAKRVRETLDLLGKVFQYRTCDGPEPGRASGSPCLDYYIKRCQAPCVGYISKEEYRRNIDTIIDFLSGRYRQIERVLEGAMKKAAEEQEFEQAALYRNRLKAVRSLLERQRVAKEAVGTLDAIAVASEETDANAQVFQVRDGVLADRQSFYLENAARRDEAEVAEEFVFEGGAPKKADYRGFGIREAVQDDVGAMAEVLSRRMARYVDQRERSPHESDYDESFASMPALIVIDGGKGQLSAGLRELGPFRDVGVTVVSLAKRIEEVFLPW